MAKVGFKFITKDFFKAMDGYPPALSARIGKRFLEVGQQFVGRFTTARLTGRPGLFIRSGTLAKSLFTGVTGAGAVGRFFGLRNLGVFVKIGGNAAPYAAQHEFGGTINGRPWLTIPIRGGPAQTRAGVNRYNRAKDVPDLFVIKSKKGNLLLVKSKTGRGGVKRLEPWYVLKRSVYVKPRLEFEKSWNKDAPMMTTQLQGAVDASVQDWDKK